MMNGGNFKNKKINFQKLFFKKNLTPRQNIFNFILTSGNEVGSLFSTFANKYRV